MQWVVTPTLSIPGMLGLLVHAEPFRELQWRLEDGFEDLTGANIHQMLRSKS